MKTNWQTKKLGEVLEYEQPTPYIVSSKSYKDDYETPVLTAGKSFVLGKTKEKNGIFPAKDLPVIIFDDFTTATKFVDFPFKVKSSAMKILRPVKEVSDAKFLFYMMQNIAFDHTGIHKRYWISEYSNIEVPIPSISEQKRIVKKLDEVFEKVTKAKESAEKNLQNSKELFESYLQSVFAPPSLKLRTGKESYGKGWEAKTLEEVSLQFGRGKSKHRPRNDKKLYGGKYPFIQTGDIRNSNHLITQYSQTYNDVGLKQSKLWPKGTICITIAANIAETGILDFDACFPDSVIGLVVNPKIAHSDFVEYLLQSFKVRLKAKGKGSAQHNINMATFEHELFPFPPLEEQKTIVKKLDALSMETKKLEKIYEQKSADLEELKKSVLSKAFKGKL